MLKLADTLNNSKNIIEHLVEVQDKHQANFDENQPLLDQASQNPLIQNHIQNLQSMKQELTRLFLQHRESLKSDYWSSYDKVSEFGPPNLTNFHPGKGKVPKIENIQQQKQPYTNRIRQIQSSRIPEKPNVLNTKSEAQVLLTDPNINLNTGSQQFNFADENMLITFERVKDPEVINFGDSTNQTQRSKLQIKETSPQNLGNQTSRYDSDLQIINLDDP